MLRSFSWLTFHAFLTLRGMCQIELWNAALMCMYSRSSQSENTRIIATVLLATCYEVKACPGLLSKRAWCRKCEFWLNCVGHFSMSRRWLWYYSKCEWVGWVLHMGELITYPGKREGLFWSCWVSSAGPNQDLISHKVLLCAAVKKYESEWVNRSATGPILTLI